MKNTLDSGSGMTLEEQVDHDKDKVFKSITADYVILKVSWSFDLTSFIFSSNPNWTRFRKDQS